jgi:hypothetical protein
MQCAFKTRGIYVLTRLHLFLKFFLTLLSFTMLTIPKSSLYTISKSIHCSKIAILSILCVLVGSPTALFRAAGLLMCLPILQSKFMWPLSSGRGEEQMHIRVLSFRSTCSIHSCSISHRSHMAKLAKRWGSLYLQSCISSPITKRRTYNLPTVLGA